MRGCGWRRLTRSGCTAAVQPLIDSFLRFVVFPNFLPQPRPSPPPASSLSTSSPHLPHLIRLSITSTSLPPSLSALLSPTHLPSLLSLSLPRFHYSLPLSHLTPSLVALRSTHFAPALAFPAARAVCYSGSLHATSYNLARSTECLFLPTMPRRSSVPWMVSAVAGLERLEEVHVLRLGQEGEGLRGVCKERGVKLVEIDLGGKAGEEWGGDGDKYWQGLVDRFIQQ